MITTAPPLTYVTRYIGKLKVSCSMLSSINERERRRRRKIVNFARAWHR
jgi:hypothetical protein